MGRTTKRARRPSAGRRAQYWFVVSLRFLVTYSSSVPSWVSSADEFASLRVYHYTLSASEVEIDCLLPTFRQWDNHLFQVFCDVLGETGFVFKRIPSLTCEEPWSIYRLLESHLKINDVGEQLNHCRNDSRASRIPMLRKGWPSRSTIVGAIVVLILLLAAM